MNMGTCAAKTNKSLCTSFHRRKNRPEFQSQPINIEPKTEIPHLSLQDCPDNALGPSNACTNCSFGIGKWSPRDGRVPWDRIKSLTQALSGENLRIRTEDGSIKISIGSHPLVADIAVDLDQWSATTGAPSFPCIYLDHAGTPALEDAMAPLLNAVWRDSLSGAAPGDAPPLCAILERILAAAHSALGPAGPDSAAAAAAVLNAEFSAAAAASSPPRPPHSSVADWGEEGGAEEGGEGGDGDWEEEEEAVMMGEIEPDADGARAARLLRDVEEVLLEFPHVTAVAVSPTSLAPSLPSLPPPPPFPRHFPIARRSLQGRAC
jgi:hypothetical protein